jgi:hypothetical protein
MKIFAKGGGGGGIAGQINRRVGPVAGRRAQTRLRASIQGRAGAAARARNARARAAGQ